MPLGANKATLFGSSGVVTATSILLATGVASASASLEFTIPATYKQIVFGFYNIRPATNIGYFQFQGSTDGGGSYGITMTSSAFNAYHKEDDSQSGLIYLTGSDLAQSTLFQQLAVSIGNDADASCAGELNIFNPSSTTYVKQWYSKFQGQDHDDVSQNAFMAGYFNTTTAINGIKFMFASGNIASGTIKMWGVL